MLNIFTYLYIRFKLIEYHLNDRMIETNLKTVRFIYFTFNFLLRNYDTGVSLYI